jgi:hypothetical protein
MLDIDPKLASLSPSLYLLRYPDTIDLVSVTFLGT